MTRAGHTYTPAKTVAFERTIQMLARFQFKRDALQGPLAVEIEFHFAKPKSVKREYHTVKPDLDNLQKAVLDSLNGIVWRDDAQITDLQGRKWYADKPKIIVRVKY